MATDVDAFQSLLAAMRERFLDELPERCDGFDNLILALERGGDQDSESFNELYRGVHSLKGSGGMHGLAIITTVCHQLESLLTETAAQRGFGPDFATQAFRYVDLLRRVEVPGHQDNPDFSEIEAELEAMRRSALKSRKAGLVVESSQMMAGIFQKALAPLPVQLTVVGNGMAALDHLLHTPVDFVVIGRETKELNGIAVIAALRASLARNQDVPVVLVTSNSEGIPADLRVAAVLPRDSGLAANLAATVKTLLG